MNQGKIKKLEFMELSFFLTLSNFQQLKKKKFRRFSTHFFVFQVLMSTAFLFKNVFYIKALCQWKLDEHGKYLMHNILKTDQQSLSQLFLTSQQTFTC